MHYTRCMLCIKMSASEQNTCTECETLKANARAYVNRLRQGYEERIQYVIADKGSDIREIEQLKEKLYISECRKAPSREMLKERDDKITTLEKEKTALERELEAAKAEIVRIKNTAKRRQREVEQSIYIQPFNIEGEIVEARDLFRTRIFDANRDIVFRWCKAHELGKCKRNTGCDMAHRAPADLRDPFALPVPVRKREFPELDMQPVRIPHEPSPLLETALSPLGRMFSSISN